MSPEALRGSKVSGTVARHVSYSPISLKGGNIGDYIGEIRGVLL